MELLGPCVPCEREREQGDEREREKREGKGEDTRAQGEGAGLMQRAVAPARSRRLDREEGIRGWPGFLDRGGSRGGRDKKSGGARERVDGTRSLKFRVGLYIAQVNFG